MGKGLRIVIFWKEWATINERTFGIYRKKPSVWTHSVFHQNCWDCSPQTLRLAILHEFFQPSSSRPGLKDFILDFRECTNVDDLLFVQFFRNLVPRALLLILRCFMVFLTHFYRRHNMPFVVIPSAVSVYIEEMNGNEAILWHYICNIYIYIL